MKSFAKTILCLGVLLVLQCSVLCQSASAQVKIGYFSYNEVFMSMPEYITAQEELSKLRVQYDGETQRAEEEFNAKYEDFLDNLSTLAASIRRKRQTELQQLMESNIRFRDEARRLMAQAEEDVLAPVKKLLSEKIAKAAKENGYIVVLNIDNDACPYIDPAWGDDITSLIKSY